MFMRIVRWAVVVIGGLFVVGAIQAATGAPMTTDQFNRAVDAVEATKRSQDARPDVPPSADSKAAKREVTVTDSKRALKLVTEGQRIITAVMDMDVCDPAADPKLNRLDVISAKLHAFPDSFIDAQALRTFDDRVELMRSATTAC